MSWASATVSDRTADDAPRAGSVGGRLPVWPAIALGATMSSHAHAFVHRAVVQSLQRVEAALLVGGEARIEFACRLDALLGFDIGAIDVRRHPVEPRQR